MPTIAELIADVGRAKAAGPAASGQIWGGTVAKLGDLLRGNYQQGQVEKQQALEATARQQSIEASKSQMTLAQNQDSREATAFAANQSAAALAQTQALHAKTVQALGAVKVAKPEQKQAVWTQTRSSLLSAGMAKPDEIPVAYPGDDAVDVELRGLMTAAEQWNADKSEQDLALRRTTEERALATLQATTANTQADNVRADAAATEASRHNRAMEARPVAGAGSPDDAQAIADAIIAGDQPPVTTGLYRLAGPVRSALAKKGYNLATANLDWQATQKHLSTLNGAQQTRMAQAVDNAAHSLDVIDSLAEQWKGGKFPILNRANLALAKSGAKGPEAQKIAVQLEAQISDVTSELGNVYMGGNSPTDHALQLAGKNLSADWSEGTLRAMTTLARTNLQIRMNSMRNIGPAGTTANNPYAPATAPTAGLPAVGSTYQGGKVLKVEKVQ